MIRAISTDLEGLPRRLRALPESPISTTATSFTRAALTAPIILLMALGQDVVLAQADDAAHSSATRPLESLKVAPQTDRNAQLSVAQNAPPPQAPVPDPLQGDWVMTYLTDNSTAVLKVEKVSRGVIGASLTGTFVAADGRKCPLSGAIFQTIAGMYPDGAKIMTMDIAGMMRIAVQCDGRPTSVDAFLIDDRGRFSGAGRATTVQSSPTKTTVSAIQLNR